MRAFIAIELSAEVRTACRELLGALRAEAPKVRWVKPENIHLTLRFLGDIEESVGESILRAIGDAAVAVPPFLVAARGFGYFPNARKPSVVWVGLAPQGDGLERLHHAAEAAAQAAGLEPERRAFKPHLTLGRVRQPAPPVAWEKVAAKWAGFEAGAWTVGDVALFASELHPAGARYTRLATVSLGMPHDQP